MAKKLQFVLESSAPWEAYLPAPERIVHGQPTQRVQIQYEDASGRFLSGCWEGDPGAWRVQYTEDEYCEILAGRIRIADAQGDVREVSTGDRFVVPAGFEGVWEVLETARKVFVMFEDKKGAGPAPSARALEST